MMDIHIRICLTQRLRHVIQGIRVTGRGMNTAPVSAYAYNVVKSRPSFVQSQGFAKDCSWPVTD